MGKDCCHPIDTDPSDSPGWRRVLWIALSLNFAMFWIELWSAWQSGSVSLQADSLDFLGDSFNYGVSLWVVNRALTTRARVSLLKGATMLGLGLWVLVQTVAKIRGQVLPEAPTMGSVGGLALLVNVSVAIMLFRFKDGDSNRQSIWLCTRNDAIGNLLVVLGAGAVFWFQAGWPDWVIGGVLAALGVQSGLHVIRIARTELLQEHQTQAGHKGHNHEPHQEHHH